MGTALFLLIVLGCALLLWSSARASAEQARAVAVQVCRQAAVQLLDETVSLQRLSLRRDGGGRLRILREYRYEYSRDGLERVPAALALLGAKVLWVQGPLAADAARAP